MLRFLFLYCIVPLLLTLSGCGPAWRTQFPNGTKLYERNGHKYFGKVIGYESAHEFHNGMTPSPAILIEPAEKGQPQTWGNCATCAATFQVETP